MKPRTPWPLLRAAFVLLPACCLIALVWVLTLDSLGTAPPTPPAPGASGGVAEQVQQQIATLEQRLQVLAQAWETDPTHFDLKSWRQALIAPGGAPPDLLLVDPQGVVRQTTIPGDTGLQVHDQDYFRAALEHATNHDRAAVSSVRVDPSLREWRIRIARWLRDPDGGFAGVIVADAPLLAIETLFRQPIPPLSETAVPLLSWQTEAKLYAAIVSGLLLLLAGLIFAWTETARRREAVFESERDMLAAANAQLDGARTHADAKAAQLEATVAGMSDGVALIDAQLCLAEWNQRFAEIAGVPADLLRAGTPMEQILRAQAEAGQFGRVHVQTEVARRMAALRATRDAVTVERARPDGHVIELRRNRLPNGGFVTLYRDVTERRQAENAMREARALAEAATAAKSRFVAIVSHEIRSPLGALLNTLRLLGDGSLAPAQQALLRMARQSGEALYGLINDILDMSSMEAGQLTLRPSAFVLAPLLESVVDIFQTQAAERGITLRLATDPDMPPEMYGDPGRLRQVLINLLSNAVKFGIPGPVMLLARADRDAHGHNRLLLAVRDRGPVIEEAGRARLFRAFSRLDLTGGEPLGSGLGLAICRYLVTLMGGEIGCRTWVSEDGHAGNEFWVRLPQAPLPAGARPRSATTDASPRLVLPRSRILLVEDIAANQLITALLLRREGHLVDVADTGEAALRAVGRLPYDLVFTDLHLPGIDGFELARQIRALPGAAGAVPLVALTANTGPDDRLACERAGIGDLLDKPVALADLVAALVRHVWRGRPVRPVALQPVVPLPTAPVLAADRIRELRSHLPPDALRSMVQECLVDLQTRLPALRHALQMGDSAATASQAHAMVGMAAGYGMAALEARLRALMTAARGPHQAAAAELLEQLEADLAQSARALREALQIEMV